MGARDGTMEPMGCEGVAGPIWISWDGEGGILPGDL
jgi:hypothetical protein